mmetsp:Transcript_63107/g.169212  ORF Transcript_63107/g.169212 Transcript_63107/m.169212 type:complete len:97 (-) Transcript_63107:755-1045(-)
MAFPTRPSTAASGSSATTNFGFAYKARAIAMRCCCPPDKVAPLSPISVRSPATMSSRSDSNSERLTTSVYHSKSNGRPITMFSRTVPLRMKGFWGT